jgi:flagellar protein FliJ
MDPRMLAWFGSYAQAVREKIKALAQGMARLETRIQIAREDMREAFADFKKIEITQGRRDKAEEAELEKKESRDLDESGLETHRRRGEES